MDTFLQVVASNGVIATALGIFAALAARCRVNPAMVHLLWLLVLAKLFAPPVLPLEVLPVGLLWPQAAVTRLDPGPLSSDPLPLDALPAVTPPEPTWIASARTFTLTLGGLLGPGQVSWRHVLLTLWGGGALVMASRETVRIIRVRRMLRHASPAPEFLVDIARRQCARLGIDRCPEVVTLPVRLTPAVWSLGGRPRILFPADLVREMDRDQLETLLAHELAHVRRRDHLVRLAELAATTLFWWHPVVWWGRTQLREMEEQACDALVLKTVPHGARTYAIALVETLDFLSLHPRPLPIGATAASPTVSLKRRIEMLKHGSSRRRTVAAALLGAGLFLPAMTLALAAEPTISFSSGTDDEGQPTFKVVIDGVPPKELSPERVRLLLEFLNEDGLSRPEMDKATQVRRLYLDVKGGPPTAAELRDVLRDPDSPKTKILILKLLDPTKAEGAEAAEGSSEEAGSKSPARVWEFIDEFRRAPDEVRPPGSKKYGIMFQQDGAPYPIEDLKGTIQILDKEVPGNKTPTTEAQPKKKAIRLEAQVEGMIDEAVEDLKTRQRKLEKYHGADAARLKGSSGLTPAEHSKDEDYAREKARQFWAQRLQNEIAGSGPATGSGDKEQLETEERKLEEKTRWLHERAKAVEKARAMSSDTPPIQAAQREVEAIAQMLKERATQLERARRAQQDANAKAKSDAPQSGTKLAPRKGAEAKDGEELKKLLNGGVNVIDPSKKMRSEAATAPVKGGKPAADPLSPKGTIRDVEAAVKELDALLQKRAEETDRAAEQVHRKQLDEALQRQKAETDRLTRELKRTQEQLNIKIMEEANRAKEAETRVRELERLYQLEKERATKQKEAAEKKEAEATPRG